jgi:hypothetical protein
MDTPKPEAEVDEVEIDDGMSLEEARALEARAMAAYREGRVVPHERMIPYIDALFRGENPSRPKTEAELKAREAKSQ